MQLETSSSSSSSSSPSLFAAVDQVLGIEHALQINKQTKARINQSHLLLFRSITRPIIIIRFPLIYLGTSQNRVLGGIVGMVLGGDLQHRRNGSGVRVNDVTDQLGQVLVDQDDVDVVALDEPLEAVLQLAHGRVCKSIGNLIFVPPKDFLRSGATVLRH